MISVESMRVVLEAARRLLSTREYRRNSVKSQIGSREHTVANTKNAGAATRARNELAVLRDELIEHERLVTESRTAIAELIATDVGKLAEQMPNQADA
jgi:hypothetical protein